MNLLFMTILLPFIGVGILLNSKNDRFCKLASLITSFLTFFLSIIIWIFFDQFTPQFQFFFNWDWLIHHNINFIFGIDGISLFFIILTTFLTSLCLLYSFFSINKNIKKYNILFLLLEGCLLIIFSILDLFIFYIFFESVLIPMFLIIGIWGSRERKIRAAYLFFIYTLIGSLMMLLSILHIFLTQGTTNYLILSQINFDPFLQKIYWLSFFASFAVKVPMLPFHIWLPEAHVEAPTAGSVILAGVLLKLGSYGFIRFLFTLFPIATVYFTPLVHTLASIAVIYSSLTAIRQTDIKRIIAYASVAHMNLILIGMFALNIQGIEGSIFQMLSHGLVSSGLFLSIGVLYDRYHTRLINYYGGLAIRMPLFAGIFLVYILANIAFPMTSSFVGELIILIGIFQQNSIIAFLGGTGMILGGMYSLYLYNRIVFGNLQNNYLIIFYDLSVREAFIHVPLALVILILGIYPSILLNPMHSSVTNLILHFYLKI